MLWTFAGEHATETLDDGLWPCCRCSFCKRDTFQAGGEAANLHTFELKAELRAAAYIATTLEA